MSKKNYSNFSSVKEIMEKMGFNKKAPIGTQKAFFQHLLSKANIKFVDTEKIKDKNEQLDLFKKAS